MPLLIMDKHILESTTAKKLPGLPLGVGVIYGELGFLFFSRYSWRRRRFGVGLNGQARIGENGSICATIFHASSECETLFLHEETI